MNWYMEADQNRLAQSRPLAVVTISGGQRESFSEEMPVEDDLEEVP